MRISCPAWRAACRCRIRWNTRSTICEFGDARTPVQHRQSTCPCQLALRLHNPRRIRRDPTHPIFSWFYPPQSECNRAAASGSAGLLRVCSWSGCECCLYIRHSGMLCWPEIVFVATCFCGLAGVGYFLAILAAAYPLFQVSIYLMALFLVVTLLGQRIIVLVSTVIAEWLLHLCSALSGSPGLFLYWVDYGGERQQEQ